jgi:hypothetical protein
MSDRPSDPAEAETPPGSVFGNLPDSRPGGRSPRRDAAAKPRKASVKAAPRKPAKPKAAAKAATKATAKPRPKPASPPPPPPSAEAEPESGGGLEHSAGAGGGAAAAPATVGVRLLSKTIEALRGNSERS